VGQPEQIGGHAHLPIAVVSCSDADHRDRHMPPHLPCKFGRYVLENHGEASCRLQFGGLHQQAFLAAWISGLTAVAKAVNRLRQESQVSHHGDPRADQSFNHGQNLRFSTLELHASSIGLLEQSSCRGHCSIQPTLVTEKGKIGDHQRLLGKWFAQTPADRLGVQHHLLKRDGKRCAVAEADHGE